MATPNPITRPGAPSLPSYAERAANGDYIRTNRDNQGAWASYLESIRKVPGTGQTRNTYETPEDRANNRPPMSAPRPDLPIRGQAAGVPLRSGNRAAIGGIPTGRFNAAQESRAGTPEANYAAGIRRYGAGMRSAPNVGAVRNKSGYNERDQRIAARNSRANLAAGDEDYRVRLLGG